MDKIVKVIKIVEWCTPYFGNNHFMPYGKLEVTDGVTTKIVKTQGDTVMTYQKHGCQYIMFNRKPYKVVVCYNDNKFKINLEPLY